MVEGLLEGKGEDDFVVNGLGDIPDISSLGILNAHDMEITCRRP